MILHTKNDSAKTIIDWLNNKKFKMNSGHKLTRQDFRFYRLSWIEFVDDDLNLIIKWKEFYDNFNIDIVRKRIVWG